MNNLTEFPIFQFDSDVVLPNCRYLDISNEPYDWHNKFSILLFNVRSCRKNFLDFETYFHDVLCKFSCIVLIETWLTDEYENVFLINGFRSFDSYRSSNGGGIRLYVKKFLDVNVLSHFNVLDDLCEMMVAEIFIADKKIVLCCLYHPPSSDHRVNNAFIDECCNVIRLLWDLACPIITCGDFNLNVLNPLKLSYIAHFIDCMLEVGLWPLITIPTKYNPGYAFTKYSLIDQFWISSPALVY